MSTEATAHRILDAAMALFAERGYAASTTREIARCAGVNEVTVFRHFENKVGVLKALGERFAVQSPASAPAVDTSDARNALLSLARVEIANALENGGVALRLAFDATSIPEVREVMGHGPARNLEAVAGYMAGWQASGQLRDDIDARILAEAFASLTSSYVMFRMVMGFIDTPEDAITDEGISQLFDIFWSGASGKEEGTT